MYVTTRGSDRKTQKFAKDIAQFCADKLMSKRLSETIELRILFVKQLDETNSFDGDCWFEDDDSLGRPKEFVIRVRETMCLAKKMRTICHEMVHVKQYATGEMKSMSRPARFTKFQGMLYPDELDYWDTPWEIEAFGRESGLYTRWIDEHKYTDHPVFDSRNDPDVVEDYELEFLNIKPKKELDSTAKTAV